MLCFFCSLILTISLFETQALLYHRATHNKPVLGRRGISTTIELDQNFKLLWKSDMLRVNPFTQHESGRSLFLLR